MDWAVGRLGAWALVLARVLGLCLTAPGLAVPGLSWRFRLGLAAMLGVVLAPVVGAQAVAPPDWAGRRLGGLGEVLTGGLLGMTAGLIVAGARAAGELVAAQAGLSTSTLFDPESGRGADAARAALRLDRHGRVPGPGWPARPGPCAGRQLRGHPGRATRALGRSATLAFGQVGHALELALRAAAPPAVALIMAGIVLGWLSRTAPSLPFLALSLPIRAVLGIVLVLLGLAASGDDPRGAWERPARGSADPAVRPSADRRSGCSRSTSRIRNLNSNQGSPMSEDRTQPPSKRRRQLAREQGQAAHSPELTAAAGWLAAVVRARMLRRGPGAARWSAWCEARCRMETWRRCRPIRRAWRLGSAALVLALAWPLGVILAAFAAGGDGRAPVAGAGPLVEPADRPRSGPALDARARSGARRRGRGMSPGRRSRRSSSWSSRPGSIRAGWGEIQRLGSLEVARAGAGGRPIRAPPGGRAGGRARGPGPGSTTGCVTAGSSRCCGPRPRSSARTSGRWKATSPRGPSGVGSPAPGAATRPTCSPGPASCSTDPAA